jgi:hypothetical protein
MARWVAKARHIVKLDQISKVTSVCVDGVREGADNRGPERWSERVSYAGKLAVILLLCHAACGVCGVQLRAQESPGASARHEAAAQSAPTLSVSTSTGAFEKQDFSVATQSDQTSAEGVAKGKSGETHRFWDKENLWLFAGVGAARALDYTSTLNMRRRGRQEILLDNSVVDNHPLFAGIEAMGTAASIGVSYWLHRTDHHRLERWVSIVHIGLTSSGAARNYALKTFHTVPAR